jgi:ribosomal protein S27E
MKTKLCKSCGVTKEISLFPKWKRTCKDCKYKYELDWRQKNKKVIKSKCVDCLKEYDTIVYSTKTPNIRCRKCSTKNKKVVTIDKVCRICSENKKIDNFYKNYRVCKSCLFNKRNTRYSNRLKQI